MWVYVREKEKGRGRGRKEDTVYDRKMNLRWQTGQPVNGCFVCIGKEVGVNDDP